MANNRIIYATTQLAIKDNRVDPTTHIAGSITNSDLSPGVDAGGILFILGAAVDTVWPGSGVFKVTPSGGANTELIRYTAFESPNVPSGITRGYQGTTAVAHAGGVENVLLCGWEVPFGVQSVSIGTTFNLEDVFQLGQLDAYENVEGIPEVEISIERVLDGTKPLWLMVTDPDQVTLKGRTASYKADLAVNVYPDVQDSATGTPDSTVVGSGMFISSWGVSMPTDGNFTESITMVGNDKSWGGEEGVPSGIFPTSDSFDATVVGSGVLRSENFDVAASTLPAEVPADDHLQSVEVSVDITREDIFELGSKTPFFRAVSFPVTVTTTFEAVTDRGDLVNAFGDGRDNLVNRSIILKTDSGLIINLGSKNKLSSTTFEGFDAGGGNGTTTFEYTNSNSLTISHAAFLTGFDLNSTTNVSPL